MCFGATVSEDSLLCLGDGLWQFTCSVSQPQTGSTPASTTEMYDIHDRRREKNSCGVAHYYCYSPPCLEEVGSKGNKKIFV